MYVMILPMSILSDFFVEGGCVGMSIITLLLAAVFYAAWKFPAIVKDLGLVALVVGILASLVGAVQMASALQSSGAEIPSSVLAGGIKVTVIPAIYGVIVYLIAILICIVEKLRRK